MSRRMVHGRGWIAVLALAVLIAVHIGLIGLVARTPLSLGLLGVVGIAVGTLKYVRGKRRS